jgi:hypothetical protein
MYYLKKRYYILLNVIFPIILGGIIYIGDRFDLLPNNISNYLPDGLWAYSFTSAIIAIWDRKINYFWLSILAFCFISFELMQYFKLLKGTGDIKDVFIYLLFGFFSIIINNLIKNNSGYLNASTCEKES